jgi:hypothetical protein
MTRTGRPPVFTTRKPLTVLLEHRELRALHQHAERLGVSTSAFVRGLILAALGTIPRTRKKGPR